MQELKDEFDEAFAEYSAKLDALNYSANAACHKYNDQIHAINSLRQNLQDEIRELYRFLKRFGNVGVSITPFEYVTEDSKFVSQKNASGSLNCDNNHGTSGFVKAASVAAVAFAPIALPAIWIGDAWRSRAKSKEAYLNMQVEFENQKIDWEYDLTQKSEEAGFYTAATEIAKLYRGLVATVRTAIRETILPELTGIDAFLVADAIKNCIISDMNPSDAEIMSIDSYKDTAYDMHYIFVRNAFDYYTMIVKFFTEPILTNIVADNQVTPVEKRAFSMKSNQIKKQIKLLEDTAVFGG